MLVRFREAEDEVNVRITVIDDTEDEDTEQFQIVLSRPPNVAVMIGPEVTADVSIIDDDGEQITCFFEWIIQPHMPTELMIGFAQSSYIIEESAGSLLLTIESNLPILGGYQILVSSRPDTANSWALSLLPPFLPPLPLSLPFSLTLSLSPSLTDSLTHSCTVVFT